MYSVYGSTVEIVAQFCAICLTQPLPHVGDSKSPTWVLCSSEV